MRFCDSCGASVEEGKKFCASCGAALNPEPADSGQPQQNPPPAQEYSQPVVPGSPMPADMRDAQDNKGMAVIAYILFFVPLLTGAYKTSPFVKYHTNQGTILFILTVAWGIAVAILTSIFTAIFLNSYTWGIWSLLNILLGLSWFIPAILCIVGIVNAVGGKTNPLPVVGGISIIK